MVEHTLVRTEVSRGDGKIRLDGACSCGQAFTTASKVSAAFARGQLGRLFITHVRRMKALEEEAHG